MTERVLLTRLAEVREATRATPSRAPDGPDRPLPPITPVLTGDLVTVPDADVEQDPRVELGQLRRAMETRPVIDMARGVLMASFGLSADDAWSVLVSLSQNTNTKLHLVADEVVGAVTGGKIPKPFRRQLAATIDGLRTSPTAARTGEE
ncbi:ANTAR domain-containing protein [Streptomyces sp. NBC_01283]|uniref:ANTAR domain-containing protein n=1 Tax=Streptomyces sp. NBC_01283 TaxID=2903812 RepID=UPI00352E1CA8|nr:ANTAR domain-containing protein [Streptomyces sp. NBC_01283]